MYLDQGAYWAGDGMPVELQTALISAGVAMVTVLVGGYISWSQLRRERSRWLTDLKSTYSLELYKSRLASYPQAFEIIGGLSHRGEPVTAEGAKQIAGELNAWLYSMGGLCAATRTRGAVLGLRDCCYTWGREGGKRPSDLYAWRNATLSLLRLDLDLHGLESYDFGNPQSWLSQLQEEIRSLEQAQARRSGRLPEAKAAAAGLERPPL
jgi:hypothetical protein